jgi:hypothetical protein
MLVLVRGPFGTLPKFEFLKTYPCRMLGKKLIKAKL